MYSTALLSTAYFPPLRYISKFFLHSSVLIEKHEYYVKQTYRNRCCIYSANGILSLAIPVLHGNTEHTPVKDTKINNDFHWQKIHWKSIETAYRSSPFFEFYEDTLCSFYKKKYIYLFDFNTELLHCVLRFLKINDIPGNTTHFEKYYPDSIADYRTTIHPKKTVADEFFHPVSYTQVFSSVHDFIPNLSIIDLLFNEGIAAGENLKKSIIIREGQ